MNMIAIRDSSDRYVFPCHRKINRNQLLGILKVFLKEERIFDVEPINNRWYFVLQ